MRDTGNIEIKISAPNLTLFADYIYNIFKILFLTEDIFVYLASFLFPSSVQHYFQEILINEW